MKKQWKSEYQRKYYLTNREKILSQHKTKYAAKKLKNEDWLPIPETKTKPQFVRIEMEMPKSCGGCKILNHGFCAVAYRYITTEEFDSDNRASWCPLQEVKE